MVVRSSNTPKMHHGIRWPQCILSVAGYSGCNERPMSHLTEFQQNIQQFPMLCKYLSPSLCERLERQDWYDNRLIRYVLEPAHWEWIKRHWEQEFLSAQLDQVKNSEEIFGPLRGLADDYDEKLFDALAEVRLVRWARHDGFQCIEKITRDGPGRFPDFAMLKDTSEVLAEAKHFRERDFLPDFVNDRLQGLALKLFLEGRVLRECGCLSAGTTIEYSRRRDECLQNRSAYLNRARQELTEEWFLSVAPGLVKDNGASTQVLDGLIKVAQIASVGGSLSPKQTATLMLEKLDGDLMGKLEQIREFMNNSHRTPSIAVVFFSGTEPWQIEWDVLWKEMKSSIDPSQWPWDHIKLIADKAKVLMPVPFELIIGQGNPVKYAPFPWAPK